MHKIDEIMFRTGSIDAEAFKDEWFFEFSGVSDHGDWRYLRVDFMGTPFPENSTPIVIVTPNDYIDNPEIKRDYNNVAVVGIAQDVRNDGFLLRARNSDSATGFAGFNYLAVVEGMPPEGEEFAGLKMGAVSSKNFAKEGDWQHWQVNTPFESSIILLTANNLNVRNNNVPAVGIVQSANTEGFTLAARNSDCNVNGGDCGFYYVAVERLYEKSSTSNLFIDTGVVPSSDNEPLRFGGSCQPSDWNFQTVYFNQPFVAPPIVLVTANDHGREGDGHNAAVVGIAQDVTISGFTLAARNSDIAGGYAGFYWVAIGCAGCG